MIDHRADSIIYQGQGYLIDTVDKLITEKRLGKFFNKDWDKLDLMIHYMEAYQHASKLDDPSSVNFILNCLIDMAELFQYPAAPTLVYPDPPAILVGIPGPPGPKGDKGDPGEAGLATDRQTVLSSTGVVDSFPVSSAKGARWDYVVTESAGNQRSGYVYGTWSEDGLNIDYFDHSTDDLIGPTLPISFEVGFDGVNIQLIAVITSGTWSIQLTRYFTPNNGSGTGPISDALANGLIWIGNTLNMAQARLMTGDVTISNIGVTSISPEVIVNGDISPSAAIQVTKLEALTPDRIVITNSSGYLSTQAAPTLTELSYVGGATSNLQIQINNKLTDPTTTIGDMIYRNGSNLVDRLPIGAETQVLTVAGGLPTWQYPGGIVQNTTVDIGDWNMDTTAGINVIIPGVIPSKIRAIYGVVRTDVGSLLGETYYPLSSYGTGNAAGVEPNLHIGGYNPSGGTDTSVVLRRVDGSVFDSVSFDDTSYNRGWLVVSYVP